MSFAVPSLQELLHHSDVVRIPLRMPFRDTTVREVMIFHGAHRAGEWGPFPEYSDIVAARWLRSALEQAYDPTLARELPGQHTIPVNATFPSMKPQEVDAWWQKFPGATSAKIKVAGPKADLETDLERVKAVRAAAGPEAKIRLDANAGWSMQEAMAALSRLSKFSIDYVEQPVARATDMAAMKTHLKVLGVRLAADELIRQPNGLDQVIRDGSADVAVLKVSPLGGINATRRLARRANAAGLEVVLSSALETSIGLSWGIRAATMVRQELGALPDAGLGTSVLFSEDVTVDPIRISDGAVALEQVKVDMDQIRKLSAPAHRTRWWRERLTRCLPLALDLIQD